MNQSSYNTVHQTLAQSNAYAERQDELNQHFGLAVWSNQHDKVNYHQINHHTLSLYLEGGYSTRRLDQQAAGTGAPGKFCLLPAGHESSWEVGDPLRFVHLYFSDSIVKTIALQDFDIDPRQIELSDLTYFTDTALLQHCQRLIAQHHLSPEDCLALQEHIWEIIGELVIRYRTTSYQKDLFKGGLSRTTLIRVMDYIHANLDEHIDLNTLANVACSSPFHFARMFKTSTGETPHQAVLRVRIQTASQLLLQGYSQLTVSTHCGFANQSHFSRTFRKFYGITPRQFLQVKKLPLRK